MKKQTNINIVIGVIVFVVSLAVGICIGHFAIKKKSNFNQRKMFEAMYDTFNITVNFLERYNVTYLLTGGTLIGAKRNYPPGPMQWDDDLDLMIHEGEDAKVKEMIKDKEFLDLIDVKLTDWDFYQFKSKKYRDIGKEYMLDLFYLRQFNGENPHFKEYKYWMISFPKDGFAKEEEFDPEVCQFWAKTVYCPKGWKKYMDNVYPGWETTAHKWNHDGVEIDKDNEIVDLTLLENKVDLVSAIPPQLAELLEYRSQSCQ